MAEARPPLLVSVAAPDRDLSNSAGNIATIPPLIGRLTWASQVFGFGLWHCLGLKWKYYPIVPFDYKNFHALAGIPWTCILLLSDVFLQKSSQFQHLPIFSCVMCVTHLVQEKMWGQTWADWQNFKLQPLLIVISILIQAILFSRLCYMIMVAEFLFLLEFHISCTSYLLAIQNGSLTVSKSIQHLH